MRNVIVSACLLEVNCKHDGGNNFSRELVDELFDKAVLIPVCPEQLGGLPTPRIPAEIAGEEGYSVLKGKAGVYNRAGMEVTSSFLKGAEETLKLARLYRINAALLKSGSPSCGSGRIRDGSFRGVWKTGDGVTTAILKENGIEVYTEEEVVQLKEILCST